MLQHHSHRIQNFDELDTAVGGTDTVSVFEARYLNIENEEMIRIIKQYAQKTLTVLLNQYNNPLGFSDRFKKRIGYTKVLLAKYIILLLASRRRMDKEDPTSLISSLEKRLRLLINKAINRLQLSSKVFEPWLRILSYPSSNIGDYHPWIEKCKDDLGEERVEAARRVRLTIDTQRRIVLRKISESFNDSELKDFESVLEKLQRTHFWSERDELEEEQDMNFTNMVIDIFCPHRERHPTLTEIASCPEVKSYLTPTKRRKLLMASYVLFDDFFGAGKKLRKYQTKSARGNR